VRERRNDGATNQSCCDERYNGAGVAARSIKNSLLTVLDLITGAGVGVPVDRVSDSCCKGVWREGADRKLPSYGAI
jgi:hypothetical protein